MDELIAFIASTIIWLIAATIVGIFGYSREIGFWGAFVFSVFLSPLGGVIAVATSMTKADVERQEKIVELLRVQTITLAHLYEHQTQNTDGSIMAQLSQLQSARLEGKLTEEEYESRRAKLLGI